MTWNEEDITAAADAAEAVYYNVHVAPGDVELVAKRVWRMVAEAALSAVFDDHDDYLDTHPDVRAALVSEDRAPVEYVDENRIRCGDGPGKCDARYSENPNWVLEHATNALSLYRVLVGHDPRPDDPAAVERQRMAEVLGRLTSVTYSTSSGLAQALQQAGFTLPQRAA